MSWMRLAADPKDDHAFESALGFPPRKGMLGKGGTGAVIGYLRATAAQRPGGGRSSLLSAAVSGARRGWPAVRPLGAAAPADAPALKLTHAQQVSVSDFLTHFHQLRANATAAHPPTPPELLEQLIATLELQGHLEKHVLGVASRSAAFNVRGVGDDDDDDDDDDDRFALEGENRKVALWLSNLVRTACDAWMAVHRPTNGDQPALFRLRQWLDGMTLESYDGRFVSHTHFFPCVKHRFSQSVIPHWDIDSACFPIGHRPFFHLSHGNFIHLTRILFM